MDILELDPDPHVQFDRWFADAVSAGVRHPEQMALATATREGAPSVRMVLLKGYDARGFVFYTNRTSRKAVELDENPRAAVTLFWDSQERQVRIEGTVVRVEDDESAAYFRTRPRGSQISAWASPQSEALASRAELEQRAAAIEARFAETECRCRRSGVATGSSRRRSSSGRAGPTASTTGSGTSSTTVAGRGSGSGRNRR